jgi:hypothetical protein
MNMKEQRFLPYSDGNSPEWDADKFLDQLLKTDNMVPLPEDFAERTALKAMRRIALRQSLTEFFIITAVIVIAGLIFTGIHYFTNSEDWVRWERFFTSRINLVAGISLVLCFIFFTDRVLLPWLSFPWKNKASGRAAKR